MGRYDLSRIEPSHEGFNPLGSLGQCNWSRAAPLTNYTALGFPWGVKALMRGLYPIHGLRLDFDTDLEQMYNQMYLLIRVGTVSENHAIWLVDKVMTRAVLSV